MSFGIIHYRKCRISSVCSCFFSIVFLPSSGTVQQSSRWSHWHPALHARDAIMVDHRGSCQGHKWIGPTMRVLHGRCICKLQVWHLQVRCPLLIILESRHICSRAAELSIELNASERIQLKDAQGSSRIYDLCKDRAGGLVLHLLANRAHLCQHLLPLRLGG